MSMFDNLTGTQTEFNNNMAALVEYFNSTDAQTSKAAQIKNDFAAWQSNLSFYATTIDTDTTWNQARNFKAQFNTANAVTPQQQAQVVQQQKTGVTSEQSFGLPPVARTSADLYAAPKPDIPKDPLIPAEYKWAAVVVVVGATLIFTYGLSSAIPTAIAGWLSTSKSPRRRFERYEE